MWNCQKCKEECEDTFDNCWNCGTGRDGSLPPEAFEDQVQTDSDAVLPHSSSSAKEAKRGNRLIVSRYTDAYLTARTITAVGNIVKFIAFIISVGSIVLMGFVAKSQSTITPQIILGGIILGAIVGIPIYVLGILVSALGQILKATLDSAVNSSPLLTKDEIRKMMSLE